MMKLFSIHPIYSDKIYSSEKRVEFRRQNINVASNETCLIYTTAPVKKITGYFIVKEKLRLPLKKLWRLTKQIGGITKETFDAYFKGCLYGTAIIFKLAKKFSKAIDVFKMLPSFTAPQSYYHLNSNSLKKITIHKLIPTIT